MDKQLPHEYHLGVAGLASRDAPESLDCLFRWTGGDQMSREVQAAILFADDEARRAGQNRIGTEHLLLGLLRNSQTAQFLQDQFTVLPGQIAEAARQRMERFPHYETLPWRTLTDQAQKTLLNAHSVAGNVPTGALHLLLCLAGERGGLAGQALAESGVSSERISEAITRTSALAAKG
ncbi:MAG: hypothetical protein H7Z41_15045 [Cytophagales bacterium]|nr:hypothetical protein [Armatimonadota bacterium]